jgi:hypothetical protein
MLSAVFVTHCRNEKPAHAFAYRVMPLGPRNILTLSLQPSAYS